MNYKLSKYIHVSQDKEIFENISFLYATRSGVAVEIQSEYLDFLKNGEFSLVPVPVLDRLIDIEAIVPDDENELSVVLEANKKHIKDVDSKHLSFTIQPSANCQLGCHYCGQSHVKETLNDATADLVYDRIASKIEKFKDTAQSILINWYGGEPLTGLSSLKKLSARLIQLAKDNNIKYSAYMVTNGLALKPSLFEELVNEHFVYGFQVTIDGTEEFHNKRRMLKNNNESFKYIFENIENIVTSEFYKTSKGRVLLRCNVDGENRANILELIDLLQERDMLNKVRFSVSPIHDWGDNGATKINGIKKEEFAKFEVEVFMALDKYGCFNSGKDHGLIPGRNKAPCMVVSGESEVYDAYGNVSTCWEIPYTPFYEKSDYVAGSLRVDKNLSTEHAPMRHWFDEIPTNDTWCKSCKFLPVCGGSCPKNWYEGTPACPTFKFNIDDRIFMKKLFNVSTN